MADSIKIITFEPPIEICRACLGGTPLNSWFVITNQAVWLDGVPVASNLIACPCCLTVKVKIK